MAEMNKMGARTISPVLIHARRRVKMNMLDEYRRSFNEYAKAVFSTPGIKCIFAFQDKSNPSLFWQVTWAKDMNTLEESKMRAADSYKQLEPLYDSSSDSEMNVYGNWEQSRMTNAETTIKPNFHQSMGGYMKSDGASEDGPPLIGFTKRYVKEGHMDDLVTSFQSVCEIWYEKVPGILAASVSRDPIEANMVHDIRIFANHAAFQAHVDKSDPMLTSKMETWFAHYDTTLPFTGELYMPSSSKKDEGVRSSSIKDRPVRAGFSEFMIGSDDMLGILPNMTKDD